MLALHCACCFAGTKYLTAHHILRVELLVLHRFQYVFALCPSYTDSVYLQDELHSSSRIQATPWDLLLSRTLVILCRGVVGFRGGFPGVPDLPPSLSACLCTARLGVLSGHGPKLCLRPQLMSSFARGGLGLLGWGAGLVGLGFPDQPPACVVHSHCRIYHASPRSFFLPCLAQFSRMCSPGAHLYQTVCTHRICCTARHWLSVVCGCH